MTRTFLVGLMMVAVTLSAPACKGCGGGDGEKPKTEAPAAKPDAEPAPMPDKPET